MVGAMALSACQPAATTEANRASPTTTAEGEASQLMGKGEE